MGRNRMCIANDPLCGTFAADPYCSSCEAFAAEQAEVTRLRAELAAARDWAARWKALARKLRRRREFSRWWWSSRFDRAATMAREEFTPDQRRRFFNVFANGTAEHGEHPDRTPISQVRAELAERTRELAEARAALVEMEWSGGDRDGMPCCPSCGSEPPGEGSTACHGPKCSIAPYLAPAPDAEETK